MSDEQVRLMRQKRMEGKSQESAAAAAGMSVRTARKWAQGELPSSERAPRHWRTRVDPFEGVWESEIVPLLRRDVDRTLQGTTVAEWLASRHPGRFGASQVRTLQRRIRQWRAVQGPEREIFFEQEAIAGREAQLDFTHARELGVTIAGEPLDHLFFELVLSFSGWRYVQLTYGETYEALVDGLQSALRTLGGVPEVVRHDNLSAATHELRHSGGRALTRRFAAVLDHYGLRSTRIAPGQSHENGRVEQSHYRLKRALADALLIRGSSEFASVESYLELVQEVVARLNRRSDSKLDLDRAALRPLPSHPVPSYSRYEVRVRKWSTIRVGSRTYSVPSRLRDHAVIVHQHADWVEVYFQGECVERMPRLRGDAGHRIDYRHVIWSLVRKPGAFARYRYREELFPTPTFRAAYDRLRERLGERGDIEYVRILHLAASTLESSVEQALMTLLGSRAVLDYALVKAHAAPEKSRIPELSAVCAPSLASYDALLVEVGR